MKGAFAKESMETIEKIVELMISKNLLIPDVKKKSKYMIHYYKAGNRVATKNFK